VAEADNGSVGDGELIPNLRLLPGEYYIGVREVWTAGRPAMENVSDFYTLTATWGPPVPGRESEPDDTATQALALAPGQTVRGSLARADDVDYYVVRGAAGRAATLAGEVTGVPGVDLRVVVLPAVAGDKPAPSGPPGPLPPGARVYDGGGVGAAARFDVPLPANAAYIGPYIVVERKLPQMKLGAGKEALPGVADEYTLSLRVKP
jgi:hypothetical protein